MILRERASRGYTMVARQRSRSIWTPSIGVHMKVDFCSLPRTTYVKFSRSGSAVWNMRKAHEGQDHDPSNQVDELCGADTNVLNVHTTLAYKQ